ncbi:MAG: aminoglycoside phosphotransferase family protein [Ilumatobacteraceae bacterium]
MASPSSWSGGRHVVGKAHRQAEKFAAELHAYRRWVPAIADRAPTLLGADPVAQVLLLGHVAGRPPEAADPRLHRRAGSLLARFHAAEVTVRLDGFHDHWRSRLDDWMARARPGVLTETEVDTAGHHLAVVAGLPDPDGVPTHRDWQPRNWLLDDGGELWAIDFEHARIAAWFEDVMRLWWQEWRAVPELSDAFFEGYGRALDDVERRWLMATSAVAHVSTIVWADEHDDAAFGAAARAHLASIA